MNKSWRSASFTTIGLDLVLSVLLGLFGGRWLDGKLDTAPWLQTVGLFFGVAAGFSAVWRGWKQMQEATAKEEREEGNPRPRYGDDERPPRDERTPRSERPPPSDEGLAPIEDERSDAPRSKSDDDRA